MRNIIWWFVAVSALLVFPLVGCGSTSSEGGAGEGGAGGVAGGGGTGGSGGSGLVLPGQWTGTGQGGADGTFAICFNVRDDGAALIRSVDINQECQGNSLWVEFDDCEGGFLTNEEIPVDEDGSFRLLNQEGGLAGYWDISGTIDGDSASGSAEVGAVPDRTCAGSWTATPGE